MGKYAQMKVNPEIITKLSATTAPLWAATHDDGSGNRISAASSAKEAAYFIAGANKIAPDFDRALWRARNVAAPLNARRLNRKTPCAQGEEVRCYDCKSPERICNGLSVLWRKLGGTKVCEVVLVKEELGY